MLTNVRVDHIHMAVRGNARSYIYCSTVSPPEEAIEWQTYGFHALQSGGGYDVW